MDAVTLQAAEPGLSPARAAALIAGANDALRRISATTVPRAAMFLAQLGEESGSLNWPTEFASGEEYEGRADLGNTHPGDGPRFKGRSFIQITGRANYAAFSRWAYRQHLVPTEDYFVQYPDQLASDRYVWEGAVWYWLQPHMRDTTQWRFLNDAADHRDVVGATWIINGGQNGLAVRESRFRHCLNLGSAILPTGHASKEPTTMFSLYRCKENGAWYVGAVGYFARPTQSILELARDPLCVNGATVLSVASKKLSRRAVVSAMSTYNLPLATLNAIRANLLQIGGAR